MILGDAKNSVASSTLHACRCGTTYCCDVKDRGCLHMQQRWAESLRVVMVADQRWLHMKQRWTGGESLLIVMVKGQRRLHDQQRWADEERR